MEDFGDNRKRQKANNATDVGKRMDADMEHLKDQVMPTLNSFAFKKDSNIDDKLVELINTEDFRAASGFKAPMMRTPRGASPRTEWVQ